MSPATGARVVFVDHTAALSGAELFLANMLERVTLPDSTVLLFSDGPLVHRLQGAGVATRVLPARSQVLHSSASGGGVRQTVRAACSSSFFAQRLRRALIDLRPDVVYTNSAKAHVLAVPVAKSLGLTCVMHVHNALEPSTYGRLQRVALATAARWADRVVVNSGYTASTLPPTVGRRAQLIYCPTAVPAVAPRRPDPRRDVDVALVGRVAPWKGQLVAVEALARLQNRPDGGRVVLNIYGDALFPRDREYEQAVRRRVDELGLRDLVRWHGHVDDVTVALCRSDVVIHCSTVPEPMGQVILEGMAARRPVVAADQGGPAELIAHELSGLLYPMGSSKGLARAIGRLIDDTDLAAAIADGGWRRVQAFSYEQLAPAWQQLVSGDRT